MKRSDLGTPEPARVSAGHWTCGSYQIVWYGLGYACTCPDYQFRAAKPAEREGELNAHVCKHIRRVYEAQADVSPVELTEAASGAQPLQQPSVEPPELAHESAPVVAQGGLITAGWSKERRSAALVSMCENGAA